MSNQSEADGWMQIAANYEARLTVLEAQRTVLVKALEAAQRIVSDRAVGGRMLTTREEASTIWDQCRDALASVGESAK